MKIIILLITILSFAANAQWSWGWGYQPHSKVTGDPNSITGTVAAKFTSATTPSFMIRDSSSNANPGVAYFYQTTDAEGVMGLSLNDEAVSGMSNVNVAGTNDGGLLILNRNSTGATGKISFRYANTPQMEIFSNGGVVIGSPTGGSQGAGTLNAVGVYDDSNLLTDFVYKPGYKVIPIEEVESFYKKNHHLPWIDGEKEWIENGKPPLGKLVSQLWETIENQQIYISILNKRLKKLEE